MHLGPTPPPSHPIRSAAWIWPVSNFLPRHNVHADFHRVIDLEEVPASVPCHITADAQYVLRVNGAYVNRGPARGFQTGWPFDTHEISGLLRPGHNVIAVGVHNPGHGTFSYVHEAAAGLLVAVELPGGNVVTDASWSTRLDPTRSRLTPITSVQMGHQEHADLRRASGWATEPEPADVEPPADPFGAADADFAWHPPEHVQPFGRPPWNDLTERGVPPLTTKLLPYGEPVSTATGPGDDASDPTAAWWRLHGGLAWADGAGSPAAPGEGEVSVRLYDLGVVRLGTPRVEAPAVAPGSVRVDLLYVQAVDEDGVPILDDPAVGSRISLATKLTLGAEPVSWEASLPMGHRFLAVVVHGPSADLDLKPVLRETIYPLAVEGRFATDEPVLDGVWDLCLATQRACLTDAYTDTPWREQAQWWGDARVQSQNTFHLVPDDRALVRGIRQIGHQRLPNGLTYGHAPTVAHGCVLPDFTLTWLLTLWDHFWQTGDPRMLLEQEEGVERALDYFRGEGLGANGLLRADPRYWLFLDWCDIHKEGTPTLLNFWHTWALDAVADVYDAAGRGDSAAALREERSTQVERIDDLLFDAGSGLYRDGLAADGSPVDRFSVQNQTLALLAGLHDPAPQKQRIADYLQGELHGGADPSSYWITYLYDAAERTGLEGPMIDHIVKHWQPMLRHGGCWESFETPAKIKQESVSHAWAAHPLFHLMRALGGVRQAASGWTAIDFRPVLDRPGCSRVHAAFPTPLGVVDSRWERSNGTAEVRLELPEGVTAAVTLPGVEEEVGAGEHRWSVGI